MVKQNIYTNLNKFQDRSREQGIYLYDSLVLEKLIKNFMSDGKKYKAFKLIGGAFINLKLERSLNPLIIYLKAITEGMHPFELVSVKKSGQTYKLPHPVTRERQFKTMLRKLANAIYNLKGRQRSLVLSNELYSILFDKKSSLLRGVIDSEIIISVDNRPFMHYKKH